MEENQEKVNKNDDTNDLDVNKLRHKIAELKEADYDLVAIGKSNCGKWIKFQHKLGEGAFKTVFKGYNAEEGKNVAWCEFKPFHINTNEKLAQMMKEIEIMVKMNHKNIVSCYDVFDKYTDVTNTASPVVVKSIVLIQELMGEGTLKSVIKKNFINGELILKFALIKRWLHQIVDALSYMHERMSPPIIHRDLKAENCFLDSNSSDRYLQVKVGDFGLAKQLNTTTKNTMLGTLGFMAPEVFDEKYNAKVDIYAFGMMMLEVITNRNPYDECDTLMKVAKKTMSGKWPDIFSLVTDHWTREVIACCIHPLDQFRPNSIELYYHPFFLNDEDEELAISPLAILPYFKNESPDERESSMNNFVANMVVKNLNHNKKPFSKRFTTEVIGDFMYNTKFNLRMEFRDKRFRNSFGLDEGERLEFDLDVYNPSDIPELINNLKSEFGSNIVEGLKSHYKTWETKTVNAQVEKIFKSIELQITFMHKMILGKRWYYLHNIILSEQADIETEDVTGVFSELATYKKNWGDALKRLDCERAEYEQEKKRQKETDNAKKYCKINRVSYVNDVVDGSSGTDIVSESNLPLPQLIDSHDGPDYDIPRDTIPLKNAEPQSVQVQPRSVFNKIGRSVSTDPVVPSQDPYTVLGAVSNGSAQPPNQFPFLYNMQQQHPYPSFPVSLSQRNVTLNPSLPNNYLPLYPYPYMWPQSIMPQYSPFPMTMAPMPQPQPSIINLSPSQLNQQGLLPNFVQHPEMANQFFPYSCSMQYPMTTTNASISQSAVGIPLNSSSQSRTSHLRQQPKASKKTNKLEKKVKENAFRIVKPSHKDNSSHTTSVNQPHSSVVSNKPKKPKSKKSNKASKPQDDSGPMLSQSSITNQPIQMMQYIPGNQMPGFISLPTYYPQFHSSPTVQQVPAFNLYPNQHQPQPSITPLAFNPLVQWPQNTMSPTSENDMATKTKKLLYNKRNSYPTSSDEKKDCFSDLSSQISLSGAINPSTTANRKNKPAVVTNDPSSTPTTTKFTVQPVDLSKTPKRDKPSSDHVKHTSDSNQK